MPQAQWQSAADGRYWIDVALSGRNLQVMIDLGLVDPFHRVAFEIDPALYDAMRRAGDFSRFEQRSRRDASGRLSPFETGRVMAQLVCPLTRQRIGPAVTVFVARGVPGVPNRVGVAFFHRLTGCHVNWDLDQQTWVIDCP
jgi:hypothetical protein